MNEMNQTINSLLVEEDIEGFIQLGAPNDEYLVEAAEINQRIGELTATIDSATLTQTIADVWQENFNLSDTELEMRLTAFKRVAERILLAMKI